jgi:hypothetical protein
MKNFRANLLATVALLALSPAAANAAGGSFDNLVVGTGYEGTYSPPTNGAIIQGEVGIGTASPVLPVDISGIPVVNGADRAVLSISDSTAMAADVGGGLQFGGYSTSGGTRSEWAGIKSGKANGTSGDYGAYLAFMTRTNGSPTAERMRIDTLGNVGIGTTSPAGVLDVRGGTAASGNGTSINLYSQNGYASGNTNGGNIILMPGTANGTGTQGNVGIGTSSPASGSTLHVYTNTDTWAAYLGDSATGSSNLRIAGTAGGDTGYGLIGVYKGYGNATQGNLVLQRDGGDVGLGTNSPDALLSLGASSAQTIDMVRNPTSNTAGNNLTLQASGAASGATNKNGGNLVLSSGTSTGSGTSNIQFNVFPGTAGSTSDNTATTAMTILGNGDVGLGTTSPVAQLDVGTSNTTYNATGDAVIRVSNTSSSGQSPLDFFMNGTLRGRVRVDGTGNVTYVANGGVHNFYVGGDSGVGTNLLTMATNGDVGIGNSSPSYPLHVNGTAAATLFQTLSDARYKKNEAPLQLGMNAIQQLKPVTFEWQIPSDEVKHRDEPAMRFEKGEQIGFIAQDVEKVIPDAVLTDSTPRARKGIVYSAIIPVLVKAMQEEHDLVLHQQTEISELKRAVEQLKHQ